MNIAIIGTINPNLTYYDWVKIFRKHFAGKTISRISITGSNTLLNSYVQRYAIEFSIPITTYVYNTVDTKSKLAQNDALIENADYVTAFATNTTAKVSRGHKAKPSHEKEKNAIIIFTDKISQNPVTNLENKREELLTVEEEATLVRQIQNAEGNVDAVIKKLIYSCNRFVKTVASKYVTDNHSLEELITEGNKGLIHAAYKFDPSHGYKFISYAIFWIRQSIEQFIKNNH